MLGERLGGRLGEVKIIHLQLPIPDEGLVLFIRLDSVQVFIWI